MDLVRRELRYAKLTALQNQIKPHYVVNTLDAIRMKLILDGQSETAELLRCLQSSLMTYDFEPFETVTVAQEAAFLEDHLKLQKFRLLGKLTWDICLQPQTEGLQIPRFLLQPLVENAVRHGLDPHMEHPYLKIDVSLDGDCLCLSVTDNGKGFFDENNSCGIGLKNVNERLRLLYGDSCTVTLKTCPGFGTRAVLSLPGKGVGFL